MYLIYCSSDNNPNKPDVKPLYPDNAAKRPCPRGGLTPRPFGQGTAWADEKEWGLYRRLVFRRGELIVESERVKPRRNGSGRV